MDQTSGPRQPGPKPVVGYQPIPLDLIGHSRTLDPIWVDLCTYMYIDFLSM